MIKINLLAESDVMIRMMEVDAEMGFLFVPMIFYDTQVTGPRSFRRFR